jgi:hypothetical protein
LLCATAAQADPIETETPIVSAGHPWSLNTAETVNRGSQLASVEAGWPGVSFGVTRGVNEYSDVGVRLDVLYGVENTSTTHFGLGLRAPYRMVLMRRGEASVMVHVDPGIKLYTSDPAVFALQAPVGAAIGYQIMPNLRADAAVDVPITLSLTGGVDLVLAPLFGGNAEYYVDRNMSLTAGFRLGPVFTTADTGTRFGFQLSVGGAYRM